MSLAMAMSVIDFLCSTIIYFDVVLFTSFFILHFCLPFQRKGEDSKVSFSFYFIFCYLNMNISQHSLVSSTSRDHHEEKS